MESLNMRKMKLMSTPAFVATMILFAMQLPVKVTPDTMAHASTNITGNNGTEDVPNLVSTPPPLLSSIEQTGDANANRTNTIQVRPPTGNYTNATALVTEGPRQTITGRPAMGQVASQIQLGQNLPNAVTGNNVISIPNINITKEQAAKAEQEANVMIKAYYEKVKQEEAAKARQEAAALAAAQANQITTESTDEAEESEQAEEDSATTAPDETETNGEGEDEEQEEGDNEDQGDENENENQAEEE
jgi:hypothetical protein